LDFRQLPRFGSCPDASQLADWEYLGTRAAIGLAPLTSIDKALLPKQIRPANSRYPQRVVGMRIAANALTTKMFDISNS